MIILSDDSETDNEAEVLKIETPSIKTNNNGVPMVEVGLFILIVFEFNYSFTVYSFVNVHIFVFFHFLTTISTITHFLLRTFKFFSIHL